MVGVGVGVRRVRREEEEEGGWWVLMTCLCGVLFLVDSSSIHQITWLRFGSSFHV